MPEREEMLKALTYKRDGRGTEERVVRTLDEMLFELMTPGKTMGSIKRIAQYLGRLTALLEERGVLGQKDIDDLLLAAAEDTCYTQEES